MTIESIKIRTILNQKWTTNNVSIVIKIKFPFYDRRIRSPGGLWMEAINISRYQFSARLTTAARDYRNINLDKIEIKPSKIDRPTKKQSTRISFFFI